MRAIEITEWDPHYQGTLVGFFSAMLPSGIKLHRLMLHHNGETRWLQIPSRESIGEDGKVRLSQLISFRDEETKEKFKGQILAALDEYLEAE